MSVSNVHKASTDATPKLSRQIR